MKMESSSSRKMSTSTASLCSTPPASPTPSVEMDGKGGLASGAEDGQEHQHHQHQQQQHQKKATKRRRGEDDEEARKIRIMERKRRNRESAERSRQRKLAYYKELEANVGSMKSRNEELEARLLTLTQRLEQALDRNKSLETENVSLRAALGKEGKSIPETPAVAPATKATLSSSNTTTATVPKVDDLIEVKLENDCNDMIKVKEELATSSATVAADTIVPVEVGQEALDVPVPKDDFDDLMDDILHQDNNNFLSHLELDGPLFEDEDCFKKLGSAESPVSFLYPSNNNTYVSTLATCSRALTPNNNHTETSTLALMIKALVLGMEPNNYPKIEHSRQMESKSESSKQLTKILIQNGTTKNICIILAKFEPFFSFLERGMK